MSSARARTSIVRSFDWPGLKKLLSFSVKPFWSTGGNPGSLYTAGQELLVASRCGNSAATTSGGASGASGLEVLVDIF